MATHYDVLGVPATASAAEVRRAYHERARQLHPDRAGDARAMADVNEAWRVLRDPGSRAAYDRTLAAPVRVHDADDPADWRYNRAGASGGDVAVGVSIARSLPWIAVLFVLAVIFVFTAFAKNDRSATGSLIGECIAIEAGRPVAVSCVEPNAGQVSLEVDRQSRCPSTTTPLAVDDRWLCVRPSDQP